MNNTATADHSVPARDRILDAAELTFSEDGFSGAGMKAIATRAEVAQGLLHYHFQNKEGLYAAVIARRAGDIRGNSAMHPTPEKQREMLRLMQTIRRFEE